MTRDARTGRGLRGFVSGIALGMAAGIGGLALVSLTRPPPAGNRPPEPPVAVAPAAGEAPAGTGAAEGVTAPAAAGAAPPVPAVTTPVSPGVQDALPSGERTPPLAPRPGIVAETLAPVPGAEPQAADTATSAPSGRAAAPVAGGRPPAPVIPSPDDPAEAATAPPVPRRLPAPVAEATAAPLPEPPDPEDEPDAPAAARPVVAAQTSVPADDGVVAPDAATGGATAGDLPAQAAVTESGTASTPVLPQAGPAPDALPDLADTGAGPDQPQIGPTPAPLPEMTAPEPQPDLPAFAALPGPLPGETGPEAGPDQLQADTETAQLPERADPAPDPVLPEDATAAPEAGGLSLPQIGQAPEETPADPPQEVAEEQRGLSLPQIGQAPEDPAALQAEAPAAAAPGSALSRFAARYTAPADLPRLGVVLLDDGNLPDAAAAVAALPWPVTVAIDPGRSDAAVAMAAYRDRGIEVMAIVSLPAGARPADVAVTYEAVFALLPETIGLMDAGEGGLRTSGPVRDQALAQLAGDGRGAVLAAGGMNSALGAARTSGVPLVMVERRLDPSDAAALRRALSQAAFSVRREGAAGGAVVLGDLTEATLAGLTGWAATRDGTGVAIAPVSAVLLQD